MGSVLVLIEHREGKLENIVFQLLGVARGLADKLGADLVGLVLGYKAGDAAITASTLVDQVLLADDPRLEPYNAEIFCNVVCDAIEKAKPRIVILGYTYVGIEMGPAISVRLGMPLASNCVDLELTEGKVVVTRPVYGGMAYTKVEMQGGSPIIVSLQRTTSQGMKPCPREAATISPFPVNIQADQIRTKVINVWKVADGEVDITKADFIVSLGRGIAQNREAAIELATKLANAFGGAVACSRPVADLGWLPGEYHVGMSGKTVSPKVYIACGISGAVQHIAGMRDSQLVIAINRDPAAPIFQIAQYGAVGDLFEILPRLADEAQTPERG